MPQPPPSAALQLLTRSLRARATPPFHALKWLTTLIYIMSGLALVLQHHQLGILGLTTSHTILLGVFYQLRDARLILQYSCFVMFDLIIIAHWFI